MSLFWLLLFCAHLAIASSLVKFEDNDLRNKKQDGMYLDLYHVTKSTSPFTFSDMFKKDEEHVRYLKSRLDNKEDVRISGTTSSSDKVRGPKPVSIPLKSALSLASGNYYVRIGLGTPAQYFSMIIDTGSSLSWLQCQPCKVYCHDQVDPLFNSSTSKTYRTFPCSSPQCSSLKGSTLNDPGCSSKTGTCVYSASYGDSSFSFGYLSQDVLTLTPSETLSSFVYGCGQDNQGLFGKAAGILGLGNDNLSMLAQLSNKYGNAFSYCLPTSFSASSSKEGFLSIGTSSLTSSSSSSYKFTSLVKFPNKQSLYFIDLTSITVAGIPIGVAASSYKVPTIIDSGTVITRLPMPVYTALKEAFVKIISKKFAQLPGVSILDTCFKGSVKTMSEAVPEVQLIFQGGADLSLKAHNTLIEIKNGTTCLAFSGSSGFNPIVIIGNYQQQTIKVAYDVANSKIGFAPGGCQ
ncbi:putative nepenthesin [Lupinus albus]|uniref:Putative nepenthesin n=1 Tax=Lupinus albus TaxID=3870 RepID=A0A6A4NXV1_LUPAL|nr:putative nepenthesin [Lupinus albus]